LGGELPVSGFSDGEREKSDLDNFWNILFWNMLLWWLEVR
jgi:hypothetical protein